MLAEFTAWLWSLVVKAFAAIWDLFTDLLIGMFDLVVSAFVALVAAIPVPGWMDGGLQALWVNLDPGVVFLLTACALPQALAILAGGYAFRMARKIVTLFQW